MSTSANLVEQFNQLTPWGAGRALIAASVAHTRGMGCRYMTVGTDNRNAKVGQLYVAAGFEPLPPPGPRFRMKFEA